MGNKATTRTVKKREFIFDGCPTPAERQQNTTTLKQRLQLLARRMMSEGPKDNLEILQALHEQIERLPLKHVVSPAEHALANGLLVLLNVLISDRQAPKTPYPERAEH
jgi:hypothetical protein